MTFILTLLQYKTNDDDIKHTLKQIPNAELYINSIYYIF